MIPHCYCCFFFESIFPISCLQGVDPGLTPVTDPSAYPAVIHGTYASKWEPIKKRGLSRMARNHIHFAPGRRDTLVLHISRKLIQIVFSFVFRLYEDHVISGMRRNCDLLIYVDVSKAMEGTRNYFFFVGIFNSNSVFRKFHYWANGFSRLSRFVYLGEAGARVFFLNRPIRRCRVEEGLLIQFPVSFSVREARKRKSRFSSAYVHRREGGGGGLIFLFR